MSEQTAKPYLVRALYEWCVESGYTPYLAVRVNAKTKVPASYVRDGEIVLNIGPLATHQLTMDNDWILFNARFNGMSQEVAVPMSAVIGLFSKETGYGMAFAPGVDEPAAPAAAVATTAPGAALTPVLAEAPPMAVADGQSQDPDETGHGARPERKRPALTVIK